MRIPESINTGNEMLDSDLKELFQVAAGPRLQAVHGAIKKRNLSEPDFAKIAPPSVIRVTHALTDPENFKSLLKQCPVEVHPLLKKAKGLAQKEFSDLPSHPAASRILEKEAEDKKPRLNYNTISRISWISEWVGKPPKLLPTVRIGLRDRRDELLLDTTVDWDDLLYLIQGLSRILTEHMEESLELGRASLLEIPDKGELSNKIGNTRANLDRLLELAPEFDIEVDSEKESEKTRRSKKPKG